MSNKELYQLTNVGKTFQGPTEKIEILRGVNLSVAEGESVAVLGASGSGKSTLLHILGTLDSATKGDIRFAGRDLNSLSQGFKAVLRNKEIGFIFQFHYLLPEFNTLENVAMPAIIGGHSRQKAMEMADEAVGMVGLGKRKDFKVTTLSGGERQRAAIARAILLRPRVVLADEPTGNLDERNGRTIAEVLAALNAELGMTLVVVTHNADLADSMSRRLELRAGELYAQS
ncbi:lipoprotein-releasing system ATP-binding protein [Paucidesulfovibrio gracilis DSM 16080]|uniref:Lipoprotein-releasing system ATP-binding protein n=1 Tax=Paucidesulfovibrio gracilis DSM 16080 TaxID=1121449 RepID=A0A1T4WJK3_9BACT|nr:ABC transporter ATP-binding protein [Paucidesulfovibrio gracilis]SKA77502.1 lipoprotein-releasing system ATP-binding protein [Paucidesulfovibrio gracilis DSM 16080]